MEEYSYTSTHPLSHTGPVTGLFYLFTSTAAAATPTAPAPTTTALSVGDFNLLLSGHSSSTVWFLLFFAVLHCSKMAASIKRSNDCTPRIRDIWILRFRINFRLRTLCMHVVGFLIWGISLHKATLKTNSKLFATVLRSNDN
jgi:hypothetical protein